MLLALSGCFSAYHAMEHRDLATDSKLDQEIKVAGLSLRSRTVYLKILDPNQICGGLKPALAQKLGKAGYRLVDYPAQADYRLRISLQGIDAHPTNTAGADPEAQSQTTQAAANMASATGGSWQGAAGAAAIMVYAWLETLGAALFPVDHYSLEAKVQLWQRTRSYPVETDSPPLWEKRQATLTVSAQQTGLSHAEASKLLGHQITDSLAELFDPGPPAAAKRPPAKGAL
ncbi:MAG: complement resistance protein TraT [Desulfarculaceae bacterium]|nr:complement resistance protein TraT [Desulfarculaceae bacterium]